MQPDDTVRIPLRARDGSVRAYALVDSADADWVNQWQWALGRDGYAVRSEWNHGDRRSVLLHRELLGLVRGDGMEGDHIDRDRLDNRRSNLRKLTRRGNRQNVISTPGSSSRYRGVTWHKGRQKWLVQVMVNKKNHHFGGFDDEEEAGRVAQAARLHLMQDATD